MKNYIAPLIALIVSVGAVIYKSSRNEKISVPEILKIRHKNPLTKANSPHGDQASSSETSGPKSITSAEEKKKDSIELSRGLCFFGNEEFKLISLELAVHIKEKNPHEIVLPYVHGECLKKARNEFSIVEYDAITDVAYDQLGFVSLSLKAGEEFQTYEEFLQSRGASLGQFGFEDPKAMSRFFSTQGYFRFVDKRLVTFKLEQVSNWRARRDAGNFESYPGVEFISLQEANNRSGNGAKLIDLTDPNEKLPLLAQGIRIKIPIVSDRFIVHPQQIKNIANSEEINGLPKGTEVILLGSHARDFRVYNLTTYLYAHGHSKISIVKGGLYGENNINIETPLSVDGLKEISIEEVLQDVQKYLVLDTRPEKSLNWYRVEGSYNVPFTFPMSMRRTDDFFRSFQSRKNKLTPKVEPQKYISLEKLKVYLGNKPILLLSAHESDWTAIIMGLFIKANLNVPIYWFRDGMDKIEILHRLKIISDKDLAGSKVRFVGNSVATEVQAKEDSSKMIFLSSGYKPNFELRPKTGR